MTQPLLNIAQGAISGDEAIISSFLPKELQPFAGMIGYAVSSMASAGYDKLMGEGTTVGGLKPSDMVGNDTPAVVIARKQQSQALKDLRKEVLSEVFDKGHKENFQDAVLRMLEPQREYSKEEIEKEYRSQMSSVADRKAKERLATVAEEASKNGLDSYDAVDTQAQRMRLRHADLHKRLVGDESVYKQMDKEAARKAKHAANQLFLQAAYKEEFLAEHRQSAEGKALVASLPKKLHEKHIQELKDTDSTKWKVAKGVAFASNQMYEAMAKTITKSYEDNVTNYAITPKELENYKENKKAWDSYDQARKAWQEHGAKPEEEPTKPAIERMKDPQAIHKEFLKQTLKPLLEAASSSTNSFNTSDDVARVTSDVIRKNAPQLRRLKEGDTKQAAQLSQQVQNEVNSRLKSYDKFRSVFGKRATTQQIDKQLQSLGLLPANAAAKEFEYTAKRMEQLAVNMGMDKGDIATYMGQAGSAAAAAGIDANTFGAGIGLETAATVGRGTTIRGLSNSDYGKATAGAIAQQIARGRETNITASLDAIDMYQRKMQQSGKKLDQSKLTELKQRAAGVRSDKEFRQLAKDLGFSSDQIDNIAAGVQYSENRNEAIKMTADQMIDNNKKTLQSALKYYTGKDLSDDQVKDILSKSGVERTEAIEKAGISVAKFNSALGMATSYSGYKGNEKAFAQSIVDGKDNRTKADREVVDNTKKFSTNAVEAMTQLVNDNNKHKKQTTPAQLLQAVMASTGLDENTKVKPSEKMQKAANSLVEAFTSGDSNKIAEARKAWDTTIQEHAGGNGGRKEQTSEASKGAVSSQGAINTDRINEQLTALGEQVAKLTAEFSKLQGRVSNTNQVQA
jgi:hypothetical protein